MWSKVTDFLKEFNWRDPIERVFAIGSMVVSRPMRGALVMLFLILWFAFIYYIGYAEPDYILGIPTIFCIVGFGVFSIFVAGGLAFAWVRKNNVNENRVEIVFNRLSIVFLLVGFGLGYFGDRYFPSAEILGIPLVFIGAGLVFTGFLILIPAKIIVNWFSSRD